MHRILIIDDDEMQLVALRTTLTAEGYAVYTTADGPQGILIYKEQKPDLILLDIGLPTMSGIDVLRELKTIDQNVRVIVVTGYGSVESAVSAIRSGACDYLQKPYDVDVLLKKIENALNLSRLSS